MDKHLNANYYQCQVIAHARYEGCQDLLLLVEPHYFNINMPYHSTKSHFFVYIDEIKF